MTIHLKKATTSDILTLIQLEKTVAGPKTYSPMLTKKEWIGELEKGVVYLIEKEDITVGSISYENHGKEHAYISGLVVAPQFWGHGIATKALTQVLEELKDIKRIDLAVHPDNARALGLYQSLGFSMESKKENYFGDGEPRLILALFQ